MSTRRSFRSQFLAETRAAQAPGASPILTDADLAPLPRLVRDYVRASGAVGKPRVHKLRAGYQGRIRSRPDAGWMRFRAEQCNTFEPVARWFLIDASAFLIPFSGLHRYVGSSATMQIKLLGLFSVADARGPEMDQSETVTVFNDMCVLAPGTLIDPRVRWRELGGRRIGAEFTNAGQTISAELSFDESSRLVNFCSDDRYQSADGKSYARYRWSTPLRDYREFEGRWVGARGDATWDMQAGPLVYGEFELTRVEFNPSA
jgi:hypothetical protein